MALPGENYRPAYPPKTKPSLSSGIPFPEACAHHITNTFHASKVYIIVSSSISQTDSFTRLEKALGQKVAGVRKGIKPHTPWDDLIEIINDFKEKGADSIVTLGGGSLTDGAKVITFALANDVSTLDGLYTLTADAETQNLKSVTVPVINIPTSLSGGEYSAFAGATDRRSNLKASFKHPSMGGDIIILDPALSVTTPRQFWLSTGIRGVDHCVEGLCSLQPSVSEETERRFEKGLKLLAPNLLLTDKDWEAEEPRLQEHLGVVEAMGALGLGVPMGGSHGIGHQLGPLGVGHGETSCIMLPPVLKYNYLHGDEKVRKPQQKVLDILWSERTVAEVLEKRGLKRTAADAGDVVGAIISELGMPRTLKDVGVKREQLDALADNCLKDRWLRTNAVPLVEKKQVLEILNMVAGDRDSS